MLCSKEKCTGCEACMNICYRGAITMQQDLEGFYHPHIDMSLCNNCGQCTKTCPILKENKRSCNSEEIKVFAGINRNEEILNKSASGGAFTALAEYVLECNGVVYGAKFDEDMKVIHSRAESLKELEPLRCSKYVQSRINLIYRDVRRDLLSNKLVLFVGTPCQVEGLKCFLNKDYDNLVTVDLVCHGVPSPKIFNEYIKKQELKYNSKIKSVNFRDKKYGWEQLALSLKFENNKVVYKKAEYDSYMKAFTRRLSIRESCFSCKASSLPRHGDITIADFWGVNLPENVIKQKGVSLILANNEKALDLIKKIKLKVNMYDRPLEEALRGNETIEANMNKVKLKDQFREDYIKYGFKFVEKKYLKTTMKEYAINLIGKNNTRIIGKAKLKIKRKYFKNE